MRRLPQLEELLVYAETDEGTIEWTFLRPEGSGGGFYRMSILTEIDGTEHLIWQDIPPVVVASASDQPSVFSYTADLLRDRVRLLTVSQLRIARKSTENPLETN